MSHEPLPTDVTNALQAMARHRDPRLNEYVTWIRRQNWTGAAVADALGVSRQAISNRVERYLSDNEVPSRQPAGLPRVPYVKPTPRATPPRRGRRLDARTTALLMGLWSLSSRVRNNTPEGDIGREASALFDAEVSELLRAGVPLSAIASDIDVEERIVRLRLGRHGLVVSEIRKGVA